MTTTREQRFRQLEEALGHSFDAQIKVGGNYAPLVRNGDTVHVSGQIPRVGDSIVVQGALGAEVSLAQGQSAEGFTQQSEVSDGASEALYALFGEAGVHARTSVGVYQLPKNAPVEIDLTVAVYT
ncbi:MAG: RidA family protein [Candidatus Protistobacter heckmanni]|nr:RidA family protein [Candidatus Protistobacter heckmanni]